MTDCDNVCRVNFNDVIEQHIRNRADITMVYKKCKGSDFCDSTVTTNLNFDGDERLIGVNFSEPEKDASVNVFLNMYVMKKSLLQNIVMDSISHNLRHFTKDVIISNLKSLKIMGYEHTGFYAGITSLQAYFNSSMSLLDQNNRHELFEDRNVFTKVRDSAPTKYGNSAIVKNSMIADGCQIEGEVENSIIFRNVKVARGAVVRNSIVMQNTVLGENSMLNCIIVDKNVVIRDKKILSGSENHPFYIGKGIMI
jgi:glucose-1-phosphate adenylyltransferase